MINPIGGCSTHPIIHAAVADVDPAYGAYADAAENNTVDNVNNSNTSNNQQSKSKQIKANLS